MTSVRCRVVAIVFHSRSATVDWSLKDRRTDPSTRMSEHQRFMRWYGETKKSRTLGRSAEHRAWPSESMTGNNREQVIGIAQNAIADPFSLVGLGTQTRGFIWQGRGLNDLGTLGGPDSFPQYVNDRGQVAGVSYTSFNFDANTGVPVLDPFL
jgi:uncharacterized membrane protein